MLPRWGPEDPLKQCEKIPKDDGIHTSKALELGAPADSNLSLNIRRDSSCSNIYTFSGEDQRKPTQSLDYKLSSLPFAGLSKYVYWAPDILLNSGGVKYKTSFLSFYGRI